MSERKVQSKYYPPDYDESKIPKQKKVANARIESRIMLPMSVQCAQCGDYLYRGKKFNAKKEVVKGEKYLDKIQIYRFFFRCTYCLNIITFKTDPKNADYIVESGATRNFEPWKASTEATGATKRARAHEDQDKHRMLENKSKDSKQEAEMNEIIENMIEKNEINQSIIQLDGLAKRNNQLLAEQEQDEREAREAFERRKQSKSNVSSNQSINQSNDHSHDDADQVLDFELDDEDDEQPVNQVSAELERTKQALAASGLSFGRPANTSSINQSTTQINELHSTKPPLPVLVKKRKAEVLQPAASPIVPQAPQPAAPSLSMGLVAYGSDSDSD